MRPEHLLQQEEALSASREMVPPKLSTSAQATILLEDRLKASATFPGWSPAGYCVLEHCPQSVLGVIRNAGFLFHLHCAS